VTHHIGIVPHQPAHHFCQVKIPVMKKLIAYTIASILLLLWSIRLLAQSVGIGTTTPHPAAILDLQSTTKGLLPPRLTQTEIGNITNATPGLMVYNTTTSSFQFYNGSSWNNIPHSGIVTGINNRVPRFSGTWGLGPGMMTDNGAGVSLNIGGTAPDASAIMDISSVTKGILIPRMSTAQREAIVAPVAGLMVYDNTTNGFWFYNGAAWTQISGGGGGGGNWTIAGNDMYNSNTGNVGIGSTTPFAKLTVDGNTVVSGGIGIATTTPDLFTHKLDVNGSARTRVDHYINRDLWVDRNFDVDGTSNFLGNVTMSNNLSVSGNSTVTGNLLVDGNKGVMRGTNGTQLVISFPSGSVGYTNAPPGYTDDVEFAFSNVFSGSPWITLAHLSGQSGTYERWTFSIHSINLATRRFWVRFCNVSDANSTFTATFHFMAVGAAL
jgi:hypothetical protein